MYHTKVVDVEVQMLTKTASAVKKWVEKKQGKG